MPRPQQEARRHGRNGSADRAVSYRLYRAAWVVVVVVPLLLVAFTIDRAAPLPRPASSLKPAFDAENASAMAADLDSTYPDRSPGSPGADGAARWVEERFSELGLQPERADFTGRIPGRGRVPLTTLEAVVPGESRDTIVVMAHRDSTSGRPGMNDNASGTAALVELARAYARGEGVASGVSPRHTLVFLSTDAGDYGQLGARHFGQTSPFAPHTVAVLNLDSIASDGRPELVLSGRGPRSPTPALVATAAARIEEEGGGTPSEPGLLAQLTDLAFPLSLYEHDAFLQRGIPALTLTTAGDGRDGGRVLDTARLGETGRAAEAFLASVDTSLELAQGTASFLYVRGRTVHGWAIALLLAAMAVPPALAVVDLLARLRRRGLPLAPAVRSFLRRLAFWGAAAGAFFVFTAAGAWPGGDAAPLNPDSEAAGHWPRFALVGYLAVVLVAWLVSRGRLAPRREATADEDLAGWAVAMTAIVGVSVVLIVTNPYELVLVLPSAHVWLAVPLVRDRAPALRGAVFTLGLAGPLLVLYSVGVGHGLGLDAPWYLAELTAVGYVPVMAVLVALVWTAAAAQVLTVTAGRYAPYPAPEDRPPRGLVGEGVVRLRRRGGSRPPAGAAGAE